MELNLTDEQRLFHETTVRFIEAELPIERTRTLHDDPCGYDEKWLRHAAELGWFAMLVPDDLGGGSVSGHGVRDAAIVAETLGRFVQPGPFIPMNVVAETLASHGDAEQQALLPSIVSGESVVAWAPLDTSGSWDGGASMPVTRRGDVLTVTGARGFVQDAQTADHLLVTATLEGSTVQLLASATDVAIEPMRCLDLGRRMAEVTFDETPARLVAGADVDRQLGIAVALSCAETVGALDAMFEMTVSYAKDRVAFGRPIGSFQAIKHILADLAMWLEACKAMADDAVRAVDERADDASEVVSSAAAFIGEHATEIAQECLQVHGGIGYTWEHDLHLFMRRTRTNSALYGEPAWHRERICALRGLGDPR